MSPLIDQTGQVIIWTWTVTLMGSLIGFLKEFVWE